MKCRCRQQGPPKRQYPITTHNTTQNTSTSIFTVVKAWNLALQKRDFGFFVAMNIQVEVHLQDEDGGSLVFRILPQLYTASRPKRPRLEILQKFRLQLTSTCAKNNKLYGTYFLLHLLILFLCSFFFFCIFYPSTSFACLFSSSSP
jgi:hypothetical protein